MTDRNVYDLSLAGDLLAYQWQTAPLERRQHAWNSLLAGLQNEEGLARYVSIRGIMLGIDTCYEDIQDQGTDVLIKLFEVSQTDSHHQNRLQALLVATKVVNGIKNSSTSDPEIEQLLLDACLTPLERKETSSEYMKSLGYMLETNISKKEENQIRIDNVIIQLLSTTNDQEILSETLNMLAEHVLCNDNNRKRFQGLHIHIRKIMSLACSVKGGSLLMSSLSAYLSVWYPRPADILLRNFRLPSLLNGYAKKRYIFLQKTKELKDDNDDIMKDGTEYDTLGYASTNSYNKVLEILKSDQSLTGFHEQQSELTFRRPIKKDTKGLINGFPQTQDVIFNGDDIIYDMKLINKSQTHARAFILQVSPCWYFQATPGTGIIGPDSSITIRVRFKPSLLDPVGLKVNGFIRIRSLHGFCGERIGLQATSGPKLQILTPSLNFGLCTVGHYTSEFVYLYNRSDSAFECYIQHNDTRFLNNSNNNNNNNNIKEEDRTKSNASFQIIPEFVFLKPGETKSVEVLFWPTSNTSISDTLSIMGPNNECYIVELMGCGGHPLHISNDIVEFGVCSLNSSYKEHITISNSNSNRCAPISLYCSSTNIKVKDIVIKPASSITVPIDFIPKQLGSFSKILYISTPSVPQPIRVRLRAHVGPLLDVGLSNINRFCPSVKNRYSRITVPIVNRSHFAVNVSILGTNRTPFYWVMIPRVYRFKEDNKQQHGKMIRDKDDDDILDTFAPEETWPSELLSTTYFDEKNDKDTRIDAGETMILHIWFISHIPGYFFSDIKLKVAHPHLAIYGPYSLYGSCYNEIDDKLDKYQIVQVEGDTLIQFRRFMSALPKAIIDQSEVISVPSRKFDEGVVPYSLNRITSGTKTETSLIGIVDPIAWMVGEEKNACCFIKIRNFTQEVQSCRVYVTAPFVLQIGKIDISPSSESTICIRREECENSKGKVIKFSPIVPTCGYFSIVDHDHSVASCSIMALTGQLVSVHAGVEDLTFPVVNMDSTAEIDVPIMNRSQISVRVMIRIGGIIISEDHSSVGPFTACNSFILAPYETKHVLLHFSSSVKGIFREPFDVVITNTNSDSGNNGNNSIMESNNMINCFSSFIQGKAGNEELHLDETFVNIGECLIGNIKEKLIDVRNISKDPMNITALAFNDFKITEHGNSTPSNTIITTLPASDITEFTIYFTPSLLGMIKESILFSKDSHFLKMDVYGHGIISELNSNYGLPNYEKSRKKLPMSTSQIMASVKDRRLKKSSLNRRGSIGGSSIGGSKTLNLNDDLIDLGMIHCKHWGRKVFVITNTGTCNINITNIEFKKRNHDNTGTATDIDIDDGFRWSKLYHPGSDFSLYNGRFKSVHASRRNAFTYVCAGAVNNSQKQRGRGPSIEAVEAYVDHIWTASDVSKIFGNEKDNIPGIDWDEYEYRHYHNIDELEIDYNYNKNPKILLDKLRKEEKSFSFPLILKPGEYFPVVLWFWQTVSGIVNPVLNIYTTELDQGAKLNTSIDSDDSVTLSTNNILSFYFTVSCQHLLSIRMVSQLSAFAKRTHEQQLVRLSEAEKSSDIISESESDTDEEATEIAYNLNFDIVDAGKDKSLKVSFQNDGDTVLPYHIELVSSLSGDDPQSLIHYDNHKVLTFHPRKGKAPSHSETTINLIFSPTTPHMYYKWLLRLYSAQIGYQEILATGVCGRPVLKLFIPELQDDGKTYTKPVLCSPTSFDESDNNNELNLDCGCITNHTLKKIALYLVNHGEIDAKYEIKNRMESRRFDLIPNDGIVPARSIIKVNVSFEPLSTKTSQGQFVIYWNAIDTPMLNKQLHLHVIGRGGAPLLRMEESKIQLDDIVIYGMERIIELPIYNDGEAEGIIEFTCDDQNVKLISTKDDNGQIDDIFIRPGQLYMLPISLIPKIHQNISCFINLKFRGHSHTHRLLLQATVGSPDLIVSPKNVLSRLDFGLCVTNKVYNSSFSITNVGLIPVEFKVTLLRLKEEINDNNEFQDIMNGPMRPNTATNTSDNKDEERTSTTTGEDNDITPVEIKIKEEEKRQEIELQKAVNAATAFGSQDDGFEGPVNLLSRRGSLLIKVLDKSASLNASTIDGNNIISPTKKTIMDYDSNNNTTSDIHDEYGIQIYNEIKDMLEEYEPTNVSCSPMHGNIIQGQHVNFNLSFSPTTNPEKVEFALLITTTLKGKIHQQFFGPCTGIAGDRKMDIDTPSRIIDFGRCRLFGQFQHRINVVNNGNVNIEYHIGPDMSQRKYSHMSKDYTSARSKFKAILRRSNFDFQTSGICLPGQKSSILFFFVPKETGVSEISLRIMSSGSYGSFIDLTLRGEGCACKLELCRTPKLPFEDDYMVDINVARSSSTEEKIRRIPCIDFDMQEVNAINRKVFYVRNTGLLEGEFSLSHSYPNDFIIKPTNATLAPGAVLPIQITFRPQSAAFFEFPVHFLGTNSEDMLIIYVKGAGGRGEFGLELLSQDDEKIQGLDFGIVCVGNIVTKYFAVYNSGGVHMSLRVEADGTSFVLGKTGPPASMSNDLEQATSQIMHHTSLKSFDKVHSVTFSEFNSASQKEAEKVSANVKAALDIKLRSRTLEKMKKRKTSFFEMSENGDENNRNLTGFLQLDIPAHHYCIILVRLQVERVKQYLSTLSLIHQQSCLSLPVRAEGGAIHISHEGTLDFGQIGVRHPYRRTIELKNDGSLPVSCRLYWVISPIQGNIRVGGITQLEKDEKIKEEELRDWKRISSNANNNNQNNQNNNDRDNNNEGIQLSQLDELMTFRSSVDLYSLSEPAPDYVIAKLWWKKACSLVTKLLRIYKQAYPARYQRLFEEKQPTGLDALLAKNDKEREKEKEQNNNNNNNQEDDEDDDDDKNNTKEEDEEAAKKRNRALGKGLVAGLLKNPHIPFKMNHPLYRSAVELLQKGDQVDVHIKEVLADIQQGFGDDNQDILLQLINVASRLGIKVSEDSASAALASRHELMQRDSIELKSQIILSPSLISLEKNCSTNIEIKLNMPCSGSILAYLIVEPSMSGVQPYRIPLKARISDISLLFDDASPIDFGCIPLGQTRVITRKITNKGDIVVQFHVHHKIPGLSITISDESLPPNKTSNVLFAFCPLEETVQQGEIFIETNCTPRIPLMFSGAGGLPRLQLSHYERIDFGRTMIGSEDIQMLTLSNIGNAALPILMSHLEPSVAFSKGSSDDLEGSNKEKTKRTTKTRRILTTTGEQGRNFGSFSHHKSLAITAPEAVWPTKPFEISPGESINLPIVFHPTMEDLFTGRVVIEAMNQSYAIELFGTGREALLVYDKKPIDFNSCLIGTTHNMYLNLMNVGEMKYPIELSIVDPLLSVGSDLVIEPTNIILDAFQRCKVNFIYTPTNEVKTQLTLQIKNDIAFNTLPINLNAGTAQIDIDEHLLDFGIIEKGHTETKELIIRNTGSLPVVFTIRPARRIEALPFTLSRWTGSIQPSSSVIIIAEVYMKDVREWKEEVSVEIEKSTKREFIILQGRCEQAIVKPKLFNMIDFQKCSVGVESYQYIQIQNFGGYPLPYELRAIEPINIIPNKGTINGNETEEFKITWTPTGNFNLKTNIQMICPIEIYNINVYGIGVYPEFKVSSSFLDYGVCGVFSHYAYKQEITLSNIEKVPITWSVPTCKSGFNVVPNEGYLDIDENIKLIISFQPHHYGLFKTSLMIESKGRYKEITVTGIGAPFNIIVPDIITLNDSPCGQWKRVEFQVNNTGDVPLGNVEFKLISTHNNDKYSINNNNDNNDNNDKLTTFLLRNEFPTLHFSSKNITTVICDLFIPYTCEGEFKLDVALIAVEVTLPFIISGNGINIHISQKSKQLLVKELKRFQDILTVPEPFQDTSVMDKPRITDKECKNIPILKKPLEENNMISYVEIVTLPYDTVDKHISVSSNDHVNDIVNRIVTVPSVDVTGDEYKQVLERIMLIGGVNDKDNIIDFILKEPEIYLPPDCLDSDTWT